MRSIKEIDNNISINKMVIGRWYRVITKLNNEYIFKFSGFGSSSRGNLEYVDRDYSYCLTTGDYNWVGIKSLCCTDDVSKLWRVSNSDVLKYFDESKL